MTIHNWWEVDRTERYWMEITDRFDLGHDLKAPKTNASGGTSWSYSLVSYVRPGDVVFHWHKSLAGEPAIIGFSEAVGPLESITMSWQAKGAAGRMRGIATTGPAWRLPLRHFTALAQPVTRSALNKRRAEILNRLGDVARTAGEPIYAPFQDYGGRELRAQQGYLTKLPATLVPVLLGSGELVTRAAALKKRESDARRPGAQGHLVDASVRTALERHAVRIAREYYESAGADEVVELGKPFDLRVHIDGVERHVEVKGSTGIGLESVQLTQGEVDHANRYQPTDLYVVEQIEASMSSDGTIRTSGGVSRIWRDWAPSASGLRPTHLRYTLPR